jgi:hypothetical protein
MRTRQWIATCCALFAAALICCNGSGLYSKDLDNAWRDIFQLTPADGPYRWIGYPVDNYGVLSAYDPPAGSDVVTGRDFICDTWYCIGVADKDIPPEEDATQKQRRLSVNGFVAEGKGAPLSIDQTRKSDIALKLLLPSLAKVLSIDAGVEWSGSVETVVTLGEAYKRTVRRDEYRKYLDAQTTNKTLKDAFTNGRLSYVVADIVVDDLDAKITLKKSFNASVKVTLDKMVGTVLAKDSSLNFSASRDTEGTYTIKIKNPVVLAVQMRHQPGAGVLFAGGGEGTTEKAFPEISLFSAPFSSIRKQ